MKTYLFLQHIPTTMETATMKILISKLIPADTAIVDQFIESEIGRT